MIQRLADAWTRTAYETTGVDQLLKCGSFVAVLFSLILAWAFASVWLDNYKKVRAARREREGRP